MDESRQPGIRLDQVYLESAEFKHRPDFLSMPLQPAPGPLDVQMKLEFRTSADGNSGAIRMTVFTQGEGHYRFSIVVGAILSIVPGHENMSIQEYVNAGAAALLYPFAREVVANVTGRGRFGPVWLHPFNFMAATGASKATKAPEPSRSAARRARTAQ